MLPSDSAAGRFATFGAGNQNANNASAFPMGGNVTGFAGMQGTYGLPNTMQQPTRNAGNLGQLPAGAAQPNLRGYAGTNTPGLQQQYGQQGARGLPGHPGLAINGLGNAATQAARAGGVAGAGNIGGLQRGPAGVPGALGMQQPNRLGVNTAANALQFGRPAGQGEFSMHTEDFPPIGGAAGRPGGQQEANAGMQPRMTPQQQQQLRAQQQAQGGPLGAQGPYMQQLNRTGLGELHGGALAAGDMRAPSPYAGQEGLQLMQLQQKQQALMQQQQQQQAAQQGLKQPGAQGQQQQLGAQRMAPPQFPSPPDRYALLGLLNVIRMKEPDLTTLALGIDLTTLGLNLNSTDELYKTFASPWAEGQQRLEPDFRIPQCYIQQPPRLLPQYFSKFKLDTLFYIFYSMPGDAAQVYAARELSERQWMYHKEFKVWLTRVPNSQPSVATDTLERGSFLVYNTNSWTVERKEQVTLYYEQIERPPALPRDPAPQMAA